jgi:hypothetical protein
MYSTYTPENPQLAAVAGHLEALRTLLEDKNLENQLEGEQGDILRHFYNDAGVIGSKLERFSLAARNARINQT